MVQAESSQYATPRSCAYKIKNFGFDFGTFLALVRLQRLEIARCKNSVDLLLKGGSQETCVQCLFTDTRMNGQDQTLLSPNHSKWLGTKNKYPQHKITNFLHMTTRNVLRTLSLFQSIVAAVSEQIIRTTLNVHDPDLIKYHRLLKFCSRGYTIATIIVHEA